MNDMHSLGRLIAEAQTRNGWSLRDLQSRAERHGYEMSHTNFSRLKTLPVTSIKGENITMLAQVLRVPVSVVATAALESMGVTLAAPLRPTVADVVRSTPELTEYDQALLTAMLDVMLGRREADSHDNTDHPEAGERPTGAAGKDDGDEAPAGGRRAAGSGQKTDGRYPVPADFDLAAHPPMPMAADRIDAEFEQAGEENQDPEGDA